MSCACQRGGREGRPWAFARPPHCHRLPPRRYRASMPCVHNRRTRTAGTPQVGAVGPPCRRPAQREKEFPHMSKRRGRHAARRPARRFVLLAIGLTLAAAAPVPIGGPVLRATPPAAPPAAAPLALDAQ